MKIKNAEKVEQSWTIDLKKDGKVYLGEAKPKADVTIILGGRFLFIYLRLTLLITFGSR